MLKSLLNCSPNNDPALRGVAASTKVPTAMPSKPRSPGKEVDEVVAPIKIKSITVRSNQKS